MPLHTNTCSHNIFVNIVFDETISIVDYTLLFTVGVTGALAWELPSQPINEEELMEDYESGSLPFLNRQDTNITDSDLINSTASDATLSYNYNAFFESDNFLGQLNNVNIINRTMDSYYFGNGIANDNYNANGTSSLFGQENPPTITATSNKINYDMKQNGIETDGNGGGVYNETNDMSLFGSKLIEEINNFASEAHEPWETTKWDTIGNRYIYIYVFFIGYTILE